MKKIVLFFILFSSFNCKYIRNGKVGNGKVTIENIKVGPFSKINTKGVFNVILNQNNEEVVKVETDENLQDLVQIYSEGETLVVGLKENTNIKSATKLNVFVNFKNLTDIKNTLVGNLSSEGLIVVDHLNYTSSAVGNTVLNVEVQKMEMKISAVGETTFKGKAKDCIFKNTAVGNFNGDDFIVENMQLQNKAVGNTTVNAIKLDLNDDAVGKTVNKNGK